MEIHPLNRYPRESLDTLLAAVPFYKAIKQRDQWQYDLLMNYSKIIEYRPGEVLLEQGHKDQWLYFLLKGQLAVLVGKQNESPKIVNYITPGEVFGDLAALMDYERTATVVADCNSKRVLVFGTDFQVFGELKDTRKISLATKLEYFRNMVHNLRWKLEVYRMSYPDQPFSTSHRKVKLYVGKKDCMDELEALDAQARSLARLLVNWNTEFDRLAIKPSVSLDYSSLAALG